MTGCQHGHHHHHHVPGEFNRAFAVGILLNTVYIAIEASCGFFYGSLALLADAGHNLSDVLGLLLAWGAHYLTGLKPTARRTYGWGGSSILASLLNALLLLLAMGGIAWESVRRLFNPGEIEVPGSTIMIVAGIGVVINTATALLFLRGKDHDLNIRGAYLHMAADAAVSVGVVLGGLLIMTFGWTWIDPVLSLIIVLVIVIGAWSLLKDSTNLALGAVPRNIEPDDVAAYLSQLPDVSAMHDLHIWAISTTENALTVHLVRDEPANSENFLHDVAHELQHRFNIHHTTIQIECTNAAAQCEQAPADVV
jgi:cobalt-zinc-cadmium efflux system protein